MAIIRWKPLPGYPGYEINRSAWVRNSRGYVVASGRGATLFIGGACVGVKRKRLVELAAEVFGETHVRAPEHKAKPAPVEAVAAPEIPTLEPREPIYIDEDELNPVAMPVRRPLPVTPPSAVKKVRLCRKCKQPLPEGYYFNHPDCISGTSHHAFEIHGVTV